MGLWRLGHVMAVLVYLGSVAFWRIASLLRRLMDSKRGSHSDRFLDKEGEIEDNLECLLLDWVQEAALDSATRDGVSPGMREGQQTVAKSAAGDVSRHGPTVLISEKINGCDKLLDHGLHSLAGDEKKCGVAYSLCCFETVKFAAGGKQTEAGARAANVEGHAKLYDEHMDEDSVANAEESEASVKDTNEGRAARIEDPEVSDKDANEDRVVSIENPEASVEDVKEGRATDVEDQEASVEDIKEDRATDVEDQEASVEDINEDRATDIEDPEASVNEDWVIRTENPELFVEDINEDRITRTEIPKFSVEDGDEERAVDAEDPMASVVDADGEDTKVYVEDREEDRAASTAKVEEQKSFVGHTYGDGAANAEGSKFSVKHTNVADEDTADPYEDMLDSESDHDFYIQKLKSEIKKLRASNLSIIPEECESEYSVESNISIERDAERKKSLGGCNNVENRSSSILSIAQINGEILTFYDKYAERMRCFDILNYQHMYTIGFYQSNQIQKSKFKRITSSLQKFTSNKSEVMDDSEEMMRKLEHDLETVYVAQTCLSWEALHWQYRKFKEALTLFSDLEHTAMFYDHVADRFQQFQVLLQRFMENEQFEGPRIQNYVKTRCVLRNILQVPCVKVLMTEEEKVATGSNTVTPEQLVKIMEGIIMTFWDFLRTDKEKSSIPKLAFNLLWRCHEELEDPADSEVLHTIKRCLHQKKLKVRDLYKKGKCIIKRLDLTTGEGLEILMALVDLQLVARVLKMSRITTDHLQWCQKKLNKVNVSEGKVHREFCTALFPS